MSTSTVNLSEVNLFDPGLYDSGDPHAIWTTMRLHAPLHRQDLPDGRGFWSVTRYHDACRVLGDHNDFTSERGSLLLQLGQGDPAAGKMLVSTDPPRHQQLRAPLHRALSKARLRSIEDRVRADCRRALAPAASGEPWDLVSVAEVLPMAVAGAVMGIPASDWRTLLDSTLMAVAPEDPDYHVGTTQATLAIAHHVMFDYFAGQVRARAAQPPRDDLIGHLMTMDAGGTTLSHEEVIYNCYSLLLGATATTPHAVSGTVLAMLDAGVRMYERIRADRVLIQALVEEGLRWVSPATSFLRHAVTDVELSGGLVRAGEAVAVWIGSANRDEEVFDDPHTFDVTRPNNRHIGFGFGPHYCLGASLSRMGLRIFFEELFQLVPAVERAGVATRVRSTFVTGLKSLPLRTGESK